MVRLLQVGMGGMGETWLRAKLPLGGEARPQKR
jgi:hypothetical protein